MDPRTAYRLAQYRMTELQAEAAAQRLAAEARRNSWRLRGERSDRGRLRVIVTAVRSLPARLRDIPRAAVTEPDVPCR